MSDDTLPALHAGLDAAIVGVRELQTDLVMMRTGREIAEAQRGVLRRQRDALADALVGLRFHRIITGMSAHIRDYADHHGEPNPLEVADTALRNAGRLPEKGATE